MGGGGGQGVTGKDRYRHHVGISRGVGEFTVVVFLLPLLALAAYPRLPLLPTRRPALCISEMSSALAPATARWGREGVWKEVWKDGQLIISHSSDGGGRCMKGKSFAMYHLPSRCTLLDLHILPPPSSQIPTLILQVRSMTNDLGQAITAAGPSIAVQVGLGWRSMYVLSNCCLFVSNFGPSNPSP